MRALFEEMAEREHLFGSGAVSPTDDARDVWIDAGIVAAVDVGPNSDGAFLEEAAEHLRSTRRDGKADQRRATLREAPAVVAERVDPATVAGKVAILGVLADYAERPGPGQRRLGGAPSEDQLSFQVEAVEIARGRNHLRDDTAGGSRTAPHADGRGGSLVIREHALRGIHLGLDNLERADMHIPRQRLRPEARLRDAVRRRIADLDVLEAGAPHHRGHVAGGLLELREGEPPVGLPDGAHVAHRLVGTGGFEQRPQQPGDGRRLRRRPILRPEREPAGEHKQGGDLHDLPSILQDRREGNRPGKLTAVRLTPAGSGRRLAPICSAREGEMRRFATFFCLFAGISWTQSFTGSIRGSVTDSSHAAVPAAKVTAIDADRGVESSTVTDGSGRYIFTTLPAANYSLRVEAPGFQKATRAVFRLEVQQQATVDVELQVGEVTSTVQVEATAPLLNTTSATLGQVIENRTIMSLPTNNRNPLSLVALAPGVTGSTSGTNFVSNGVRNSASEVMLDGGAVTGIEQNGGITEVKFNATVDVIEEFKVQTNYFSAEFGNSGGTIVNMVSKSGTNEFHGVGYYFRRDNALNANNWFSNARGGSLVDSTVNNYGGVLGGPVWLPGIYKGKNRTFFFMDYDRSKSLSATSTTASVPTAQQLAGDFSDTRLGNGNLVPLFDPFSTFVDASGNTLRNPIPGNVIPAGAAEQDRAGVRQVLPGAESRGRPLHARQQLVRAGQHAERRQQARRQDRPQHFREAAHQHALWRELGLERSRQPDRQHRAQRQSGIQPVPEFHHRLHANP